MPAPHEQPILNPGTRRRHLAQLREAPLDVLILGGGINGAGIARDLALRAHSAGVSLRIGLVEQRHFASGTSSRNSQLIHGGLRYLKQFQFQLVRESLRERATLLELAPHLVEPLQFLMPLYGLVARPYYGAGLFLYDTLAGRQRIARHGMLSRRKVLRLEPGLRPKRLSGGALFFDARVHAARFVLANVCDAVRHGVLAVNYLRAGSWTGQRDHFRATLRDTLSGETFEVRARKIVDATGPWGDPGALRLVRGSHLVLPRLPAGSRAIAHFDEAGRIVFLIPWGDAGELTLLGTTDVDHSAGPDQVRISADETRYLLGIAKKLFPAARDVEPLAAYSSLRPLLHDEAADPSRATREHRIWNSPDGVLHLAGGKYTTYRAMSEEACDLLASELEPKLAGLHVTAEVPLEGNARPRIEEMLRQAPQIAREHGLSENEALLLVKGYGIYAPAVLRYLPADPPTGLTRLEAAQTAYAVHHEMAERLADLMFVSTYWGYQRRLDALALRPYAFQMGRLLRWDEAHIRQETELVLGLSGSP